MALKLKKNIILCILLSIVLIFGRCRFLSINQPGSAQPGEIIEIVLTVYDNIVLEPNPHRGVLCILVPDDWSFVSGEYSGSLGTGIFEDAPNWADSVESVYPASQMGQNMKWIGTISDSGYTYQDEVTLNATLRLQVGQTEGNFQLGYLVTKATSGMLGNITWAPLSYPHPIGVPDSVTNSISYPTRRAEDWELLLKRTSGWTGADGIYSIPFSGVEVPLLDTNGKTCLVFSDTFIGEVDSTDRRIGSTIVNNTLALLEANQPDSDKIQFFWGVDEHGRRDAIFKPDTPEAKAGDWYWLMDGIAIDDRIYVYAIRLQKTTGGVWNFEVIGVVLISFKMASDGTINDIRQMDTPLFDKDDQKRYNTVLGQAIMPMTTRSRNPNPDGYIYVYGPKSYSGRKDLVASRVLPEDIEDFTRYTFWDGSSWSQDITQLASITSGLSQEFSVSPLNNGQFIAVFQLGNHVAIRIGESPTGPFAFRHEVWRCPEPDEYPGAFVYNAKAHPHLSTRNELLISYNVNTFNFWDHFAHADIYRPRFIWLELDEGLPSLVENSGRVTNTFILFENYPNPFNPYTTISYQLFEAGLVEMDIFNILGQKVRTLVHEEKQAGRHWVKWKGMDDRGERVVSGVYFYRLQAGDRVEIKKMTLLK